MLFFEPEKSQPTGFSTMPSTPREPLSSRMKRIQESRSRHSNSASIPYKHKVIIVDVAKDKAFGATSTRFQYRKEMEQKEGPGPGDYNLYKETIWADNKASFSRKGNTNFLSKVFRTNKTHEYYNTGPGPGTYSNQSVQSMMKSLERQANAIRIRPTSFSTTNVNNGRSQRFNKKSDSDIGRLGPGVYHPENFTMRPLTNSAGVGFKSTTQRVNMPLNKEALNFPDSWNYHLSRNILKSRPESINGLSCFSQPTALEKKISTRDFEAVKKTILAKDEIQAAELLKPVLPGPGTYNIPNDFDKLVQDNQKQKMLVTGPISKIGTPRLATSQTTVDTPRETSKSGIQWVANKNPGPGSYDPFAGFPEEKFDKSNHVFVSTTKREAFPIKPPVDFTAPYTPTLAMTRRSFNRHKSTKWI